MSLYARLAALLLVATALAALYMKGRADGRQAIQNEIQAQTIASTAEARRLEQKRQDAADGAARLAAQREAGIRADAARARAQRDGLRGDLDAIQRASADSIDAARKSVTALSDVFQQCSRRYSDLAEIADRHAADSLMFQQSWPR